MRQLVADNENVGQVNDQLKKMCAYLFVDHRGYTMNDGCFLC